MRASRRSQPSIGNTIGSLVDSHYRDRASLNRIRELGTVVAFTAALIHELQRERGLSSGYVAGGRSFLKELEEQTARCEETELRALDVWASVHDAVPGLQAAMADARALLAELPRLRGDVRAQAMTPNAVVQRFSTLVDRLLVVVAEAPGHSSHPQVTLALIALFNFILAKEYTGQLRALGSAVCAQRSFEPFQFETFQVFRTRRNETLDVFVRHLTKEPWDQWVSLKETVNFRALDGLLARLDRLGHGQGTAPAALDWYHAVTAVIDDMRRFEMRQLDELDRLCLQVFAEARSAWEDSQETPEERDRLFLARLERTHLRLQEERLQTRGPDQPAGGRDQASVLAHDATQAVEEARRWRQNLDRWTPLTQELAEGARRARLLALDASIDAITPAEVARSADALARQLMTLAEQLDQRVADLRSSADQSVDAFETVRADALKLQKDLLGSDSH
jgi:hypothetical protein